MWIYCLIDPQLCPQAVGTELKSEMQAANKLLGLGSASEIGWGFWGGSQNDLSFSNTICIHKSNAR